MKDQNNWKKNRQVIMYLKMNTKYNAIPKKGKNSLKDGKYWET